MNGTKMIASVIILAIIFAAALGLFAFAELRYLTGLRAVDRAWRKVKLMHKDES